MIRPSIVGTASSTPAPWRSIWSSVASGSKRRRMTIGDAERERGRQADEPVQMEQRRRDDERVPGPRRAADPAEVGGAAERERHERPRTDRALGALRRAGRSGRQHRHAAVPPRCRRDAVLAPAATRDRAAASVGSSTVSSRSCQATIRAPAKPELLDDRPELAVEHDRARALPREHVTELGAREVRAQRHEPAPEPRRRDRRHDEPAVVAAHDRDGGLGAEREAVVQRGGERPRLPVEVIETQRAEVVDDGRAAGIQRGGRAGDGGGRRAEALEREQGAGDAVRADRSHDSGDGAEGSERRR